MARVIKLPSLTHEFSLVYSGDPALRLPEAPPDATDDQRIAAAKERERLLKLARETGNWHEITAEGQVPTVFTFRDLSRAELSWIYGEQSHSTVHNRPLSAPEFTDLLFRIALRGVVNFGEHKVERKKNRDGIFLADMKILDVLFEYCGSGPIVEFAQIILKRAEGPGPLS